MILNLYFTYSTLRNLSYKIEYKNVCNSCGIHCRQNTVLELSVISDTHNIVSKGWSPQTCTYFSTWTQTYEIYSLYGMIFKFEFKFKFKFQLDLSGIIVLLCSLQKTESF